MSLLKILVFIIFFVALDQVTKFIVSVNFSYGESINLLPFLDLTLMHNTGVAFSFLSEEGPGLRWLLVLLVLVIISYLLYVIMKVKEGNKFELLALLFIVSGGISNLIDRFFLGYVIDFIHLNYLEYSFYIFNLADSWITIGVILYIIYFFFFEKAEHEDKISKS